MPSARPPKPVGPRAPASKPKSKKQPPTSTADKKLPATRATSRPRIPPALAATAARARSRSALRTRDDAQGRAEDGSLMLADATDKAVAAQAKKAAGGLVGGANMLRKKKTLSGGDEDEGIEAPTKVKGKKKARAAFPEGVLDGALDEQPRLPEGMTQAGALRAHKRAKGQRDRDDQPVDEAEEEEEAVAPVRKNVKKAKARGPLVVANPDPEEDVDDSEVEEEPVAPVGKNVKKARGPLVAANPDPEEEEEEEDTFEGEEDEEGEEEGEDQDDGEDVDDDDDDEEEEEEPPNPRGVPYRARTGPQYHLPTRMQR